MHSRLGYNTICVHSIALIPRIALQTGSCFQPFTWRGNMTVRLGIVMDPIEKIHFKKDSSLAMLLAAQKRGWEIEYMELPDLYLKGG